MQDSAAYHEEAPRITVPTPKPPGPKTLNLVHYGLKFIALGQLMSMVRIYVCTYTY